MLTPELSVLVAALGYVFALINNKDFRFDTHWKDAVKIAVGSTAIWILWWKVGLDFLGLKVGDFNYLVFFLPALVDQLAQRVPVGKK